MAVGVGLFEDEEVVAVGVGLGEGEHAGVEFTLRARGEHMSGLAVTEVPASAALGLGGTLLKWVTPIRTSGHLVRQGALMKISGNTILVTGGTSGIGRALAEALHDKGNTVIIAGRRQALLDEVTGRHPGMTGIAVDLSDSAAIAAFAESVKKRFPELNVLLNNAGIAGLEDYTADTIDLTRAYSTIQTNITGVLQLSAALLPTLRAQQHSTLIVTTSGLAFVPYPPGPVYSATKAFMHNWLDALRVQLKKTSVEVLELAPPYVQTELGGPQQASDPRAMPLDEYTREVMQILENNTIEKGEILVERVKPLRSAEREGKYEDFLTMFAGMHD